MQGKSKTSLARIRISTTDGKGSIGSAYPVASNLLITARHVVKPETPRVRDADKPINVTWVYLDDLEQSLAGDPICWESERFDVCLLTCDVPSGALPKQPSRMEPPHGKSWGSEGFAQVGKTKSARSPVALQGRTYSQEPGADRFDLGIDDTTSLKGGWKGASGSPVFVDDQLIGVITDCPLDFDQGRFKASATFRFYEDASFVELLIGGERNAYLLELEKFVQAELARAPDALAALAAAAGYDHQERLSPAILSQFLLREVDIGKTVSAFRKAHESLRDTKSPVDQQSALLQIINRTIPAIVMPEAVETIRRLRHDPGESVISLPAFQLTVAEFLMSGADRRPLSFDNTTRKKRTDWPRGSFYLSDRLECGPEQSADFYEQAVRKALEAEYADAHTLHMLRHDPAGRAEHIRDNLGGMAETPYFICDPECQGRQTAYQNLKRDFRYIVFLQLKPDRDIRKREHELFYDILDLLAPVTTEKK